MIKQYSQCLRRMEAVLLHFESLVPPPKKIPMFDHFVFRYTEETIEQAIIQKLARVITGLKSAYILLGHGFFQEQGAIQRMLDEFQQDISFLCLAIFEGETTELHKTYLDALYQEEFNDSEDPVASRKKRPMVPRKKIIAFLARAEAKNKVNNPSRSIDLTKTLSKAYSGFVHGASPQIMNTYGGNPPSFHVSGMLGTTHEQAHRDDLWNYFYRGILSFEEAAYAFGELRLANDLCEFSSIMAEKAGKKYK